jgi:DNA-binding NarL/FixJ family response regulator
LTLPAAPIMGTYNYGLVALSLIVAAGMDGYVSKPVRTAELFTAIETVMRGWPALHSK